MLEQLRRLARLVRKCAVNAALLASGIGLGIADAAVAEDVAPPRWRSVVWAGAIVASVGIIILADWVTEKVCARRGWRRG